VKLVTIVNITVNMMNSMANMTVNEMVNYEQDGGQGAGGEHDGQTILKQYSH
jgi:hypothetical protein